MKGNTGRVLLVTAFLAVGLVRRSSCLPSLSRHRGSAATSHAEDLRSLFGGSLGSSSEPSAVAAPVTVAVESEVPETLKERVERLKKIRERARRTRLQLIKNQIETMLNIKGDQMPSVEEEFGGKIDPHSLVLNESAWSNIQFSPVLSDREDPRAAGDGYLLQGGSSNKAADREVLGSVNSSLFQKILESARNVQEDDDDDESPFYIEKIQSLYPTCKAGQVAVGGDSMFGHLYFSLNHMKAAEGHSVKVLDGKLKVYQNGLDMISSLAPFSSSTKTARNEEQKIRTTVSLVKRPPLNQGRFEYEMLDSQTSDLYRADWLRFDIKRAVDLWANHPEQNLGVLIEVEDNKRQHIPAMSILKGMNCTDDFRNPFPSILEDISEEILNEEETGSEASPVIAESLNTNLYPVLDVCIVDVPVVFSQDVDVPDAPEMQTENDTRRVQDQQQQQQQLRSLFSSDSAAAAAVVADFPNFHTAHIGHNAAVSSDSAWNVSPKLKVFKRSENETTESPDEFVRLTKLEEIDFLNGASLEGTRQRHQGRHRNRHHQRRHHRRDHDRRLNRNSDHGHGESQFFRAPSPLHEESGPDEAASVYGNRGTGPEFKPVIQKVVMTSQELYNALKKMIDLQEGEVQKERLLLNQIVVQNNLTHFVST